MTNETPGSNGTGPQPVGSEIENRAKAVLGLNDLEQEPRALPIRVERMWRGEHFSAHVPYTGSILFPMGHAPDLAPWQQSIAAVVERHEALHSRLAVVHDRAVQIPDHRGVPDLEVVRVSRSDIAGYRDRGSPSPLTDFFAAPINLFEDTAIRCRAFQDEDENLTLGILMHHYFGDAWSSQILRREIETVHAAHLSGAEPDLPPVAQYSDYALVQRRFLAKTLPAQLAYWHQRLASAPPSRLPFDRHEGTNQLGRALFTVPPQVLAKLMALSQIERISLPMLCLAAFQVTLARWCGERQAVTAVTSADRIKAQFRNTIGRLMAGIPVYSAVSENMSIREFFLALAKQFYDAIAHQDLAFEQYDEIFSPPPPFCTTRFNFIPRQEGFFLGGDGAPSFSGLLQLSRVKKAMIYRDLHFLLMQYPDGLVGRVIYNLDFSLEKIEDFVEAFRQILGKIADDPGGKLGELF